MADKKVPTNTERHIMQSCVLGPNPNAILKQEAEGQQSFVNSETLPTDMRPLDYNTNKILEVAGIKFLGVVKDDNMFQYVKLPKGWEKKPTDHSMWSVLVDDKNRERASIFYKAAFYDRSAHIRLTSRFGIRQNYDRQYKENVVVMHVTDCDEIVHTTDPIQLPNDIRKYKVIDQAKKVAVAWLDENYPYWQNPGAYWD
jgi:hypothetical protein